MNIKQNRSRFEVRSSHLVALPVWIEHPISRRGPSSQSPHTYNNHHFFTNKYRVCHTNPIFYEDNYTYKINHFTIDGDCIAIHNQFSAKSTNANHSLHDVNPTLNDANPPLHEHNRINININYDKQETMVCTKSLAGDGGAPPVLNDEKLNINTSDDGPLPDMRACHNCNMDHDEEEAADNFTFSTSAADSMEYFQFMKSSSSRYASEAGDTISVMSHADELFEDGKIRPLLPPVIEIGGSRNDNLPSKLRSAEDSLIVDNYEVDRGGDGNERAEITQRIDHKGIDDDEDQKAALHSLPFKFMSLSAPASPVRATDATNYDHNEERQIESEISTNYNFKRCRSLTRAFPSIEDNKEKTSEERRHSSAHHHSTDRKGGGNIMSRRRTTLEDFLKQEGNHVTLKPNQEQLGLKTSHRHLSNSCDVLKRPSLAPSSINLPQLWPAREPLWVANKKKVMAPSPHVVHYTFHKAQAERMKRKTFLPYRPRLLGCLGYPH
ncbi:hypothetical protein GOP47_0009046 [Adiantum capillus-veneris]|uniref:Uncharacterized protein n=1 Tax=Adiantum capillus-veneris TaxID=13818 RepID=A0A9D4UZG0_ADICA|nr:hypothetical protein GOP47_0009046 [Adiantum capillus-veneris]